MTTIEFVTAAVAVAFALVAFPRILSWLGSRNDERRYQRRRCAIQSLAGGPLSGDELREILHARGLPLSGPAFYAMMADFERSGAVEAWYEHSQIDGQPIKERWYRSESLRLSEPASK
jgi:hypothetical protein